MCIKICILYIQFGAAQWPIRLEAVKSSLSQKIA
jgi:hypothetical protein